jgi:hypothetical protein
MVVIAVGDRSAIEADLKKLNLGAVEIRETPRGSQSASQRPTPKFPTPKRAS